MTNNVRDAFLREIISNALVLCGKKEITSLQDDRDDLATAKSQVGIVVDMTLRKGFFTDGVKETILTPVPEPDRSTSSGVQYRLPSDFIGVRDVRIALPPIKPELATNAFQEKNTNRFRTIHWFLEGKFLILPFESYELSLLYVSNSSELRQNPLFLEYASYELATRIAQSISAQDKLLWLERRFLEIKQEVASLSCDDQFQSNGSALFGDIFWR